MTMRVLTPDDFAAYRQLRLEALAADPQAFCSTHARESGFDEATWRQRLTGIDGRLGAVIVHGEAAPFAGMVGAGASEIPGAATLWGMWVRPDARGTGAGERLVGAALDWCAAADLRTIDLWVVVGNAKAIALYERCGFAATGAADVVPGRPGVAEVQMRRT